MIYDQCPVIQGGGEGDAVSLHAKQAQRAVMGIALPYSTPALEGSGSLSSRPGAPCVGGSIFPV